MSAWLLALELAPQLWSYTPTTATPPHTHTPGDSQPELRSWRGILRAADRRSYYPYLQCMCSVSQDLISFEQSRLNTYPKLPKAILGHPWQRGKTDLLPWAHAMFFTLHLMVVSRPEAYQFDPQVARSIHQEPRACAVLEQHCSRHSRYWQLWYYASWRKECVDASASSLLSSEFCQMREQIKLVHRGQAPQGRSCAVSIWRFWCFWGHLDCAMSLQWRCTAQQLHRSSKRVRKKKNSMGLYDQQPQKQRNTVNWVNWGLEDVQLPLSFILSAPCTTRQGCSCVVGIICGLRPAAKAFFKFGCSSQNPRSFQTKT